MFLCVYDHVVFMLCFMSNKQLLCSVNWQIFTSAYFHGTLYEAITVNLCICKFHK